MEEQQQQQQHQQQDLPPAVVKVRWKPNEEQLRMLVRLFEEEGDSINKQRIKEIAVDLAQCGDVTEANVHNWFHNRKARAKRKQKLMQQNDGESEVDTDVDSKGKRTKLDHKPAIPVGTNPVAGGGASATNGALFLPDFAQPDSAARQQGFPMRQPLRLPSDSVNFSTRMYERSLMLTPHHGFPPYPAAVHPPRMPGLQQELVPEAQMIEWRPRPLALMLTEPSGELLDRSSESKTITDDASTESEDVSDTRARNLNKETKSKKSWKKKGKGTMIRKPVERAANGRSSSSKHGSSRKSRIREIIKSLKRNGDSYERDLKALFVEIVGRIGGSKARSILNRVTRHDTDTSSDSRGMDSGSCSSTASLPQQSRKLTSSSPSEYVGSKAAANQAYSDPPPAYRNTQYQQPQQYQHQEQQQKSFHPNAAAAAFRNLSNLPRQWSDPAAAQLTLCRQQQPPQQMMMSVRDKSSTSGGVDGSSHDDEETDCEREEFRIVWSSSQKQQEALIGGLFSSPSFDNKTNNNNNNNNNNNDDDSNVNLKTANLRQQLEAPPPEGDKTNVTLIDGRPTGTSGTWWNSTLRHSALQNLDISIPHIGLQPEEGMVRIRDQMDSKFCYVGGSLDDGYLKKQVAKALNFRRHKVMKMIEQGSNRPSDITEEQWDALIKYYADPKRREKSDKQRAALKALNMIHQQQMQQIQPIHHPFNLNMSIGSSQADGDEEEDRDDGDEDGDGDDEDDDEDDDVQGGSMRMQMEAQQI